MTTTLITGASKGIGRAIAERMHAAGHGVVGIARHQPDDGFPHTFESLSESDWRIPLQKFPR